jgi:hypothetical protein
MNENRDSVGNYSNSEFMFSSTARHSESFVHRELLLVEMTVKIMLQHLVTGK